MLPAGVERQPEQRDETRAVDRAAIERLLTRRDIPLREKTLWRMLYETAARANEILALNIENLEVDARRVRITAKGGATEYVYWASGTAHLLPRLIRGRDRGPVFLSERRPGPARRPRPKTCARTPAGPDWATTGPGSCWTATPRPARVGQGGIFTSCATRPPPTSAKPTSASN
ncbi:tyrosine-type recombinase/integrase [Micromonospora harpali]|uniref:Tyrosine-type recombinase/integrase n=1 Tax=Micromonospora harpali TaxID=1490225 RepID=A0ABW1HJ11_9ACTN